MSSPWPLGAASTESVAVDDPERSAAAGGGGSACRCVCGACCPPVGGLAVRAGTWAA